MAAPLHIIAFVLRLIGRSDWSQAVTQSATVGGNLMLWFCLAEVWSLIPVSMWFSDLAKANQANGNTLVLLSAGNAATFVHGVETHRSAIVVASLSVACAALWIIARIPTSEEKQKIVSRHRGHSRHDVSVGDRAAVVVAGSDETR